METSDIGTSELANRLCGQLLAEPMTIKRLARYYGVGRGKMAVILNHMAGAERCGRLWRVPLRRMPPAYFIHLGILPSQSVPSQTLPPE